MGGLDVVQKTQSIAWNHGGASITMELDRALSYLGMLQYRCIRCQISKPSKLYVLDKLWVRPHWCCGRRMSHCQVKLTTAYFHDHECRMLGMLFTQHNLWGA